MTWWMAALVGSALAQSPFVPAPAAPKGPVMYAVSDVVSTRFPDAETAGPELTAGDEVVVLIAEEGRIRFKRGASYGWVPAEALTDQAPEAAAPSSLALPAGFGATPPGSLTPPPATPALPPPGAGAGN